jgi:hypothetical protein
MIKITTLRTIAGALLVCGLSAVPAQAGPNRTSVSGTGTDSGPCTRAAPCRTFAFALTQTAAGGEIDVLDPAGYGPVTINKSISIVNDGAGVAGMQSAGFTNGVTINAGAGNDVHLRGLTIQGLGSGKNGIEFATGGNLTIENCVIRNFTENGIAIVPTTSSNFSVSNTIASNNGNGAGIIVQAVGAAVISGVLSNVTANNNGSGGIEVDGRLTTGASLNVTIVDSEASNNRVNTGVFALSAIVMLRNVVASNNSIGLATGGSNSILRVGHSVVTGNGTGVFPGAAGTIVSYGDNDIDGNTNNNTGALTTIPKH